MDPTDDLKAKSPPVVTGSTHVLPFSALSPGDFERLCLALAHLEGYERPEHVGASGPDGGRDIVAFRNGRRVVFQCKRYRTLKPKEAEAVVEKILALPERERPEELILLTSCSVGAEARERARSKAGSIDFQVWALTELDERVNRHSDLVARFFQLPAKTTPSKPTVPGNVLRERLAKPSLRWGAALGFAVLAAMAGSSPAITPQRGASFPANSLRRSKVPLPRPSLAVMTFKNKTGDAALDWLSTALAETVSAKLGLRGDIRTVDRLEVSLAETDLLLAPRAEISHQDRERIRSLLGTEFVLG
ncbi:MAG TPA: restriction endonuclease, partial [Thermoanaerobaculia bacterium]|nr:restriction endonuclease [Thermoanaerobaculia bacterium]